MAKRCSRKPQLRALKVPVTIDIVSFPEIFLTVDCFRQKKHGEKSKFSELLPTAEPDHFLSQGIFSEPNFGGARRLRCLRCLVDLGGCKIGHRSDI